MQKILLLFIFLFVNSLFAQPKPGDVFKEYMWFNTTGSAGQALRVGGLFDYGGEYIDHPANLDLTDAIKAEIFIEKIESHAHTEGLSIELNDKGWVLVPEAINIPAPQKFYQHHIYPIVSIPLTDLNQGINNKFRMTVIDIPEGWPQNLIYGVHFRIYYDATKKPHPTGNIVSPTQGEKLGDIVRIKADAITNGSDIETIQFIGKYEDINYEGDGIYRQWHYHYFHGQIKLHLGETPQAKFGVDWNTSWVPDQPEPMEIAARIIDKSGMIYFTQPVTDLQFDRPQTSIVLVKPYDIPKIWATRTGLKLERFFLRSNLDRIQNAQMVWTSWSPSQMDGLYINEHRIFEKEGPTHKFYFHRVNLANMNIFKEKENILFTAKTEGGIHGMEVQWPGVMLLLKVDLSNISKIPPSSPDSLSAEFLEQGLKIKWKDKADNERGFIVERKIEGGSFSIIQNLTSMDKSEIIDSNLVSPNRYTYRISSFNDYGTSPYKEISIATPDNKVLLEFKNQSQYLPNINWLDNAGFYFLHSDVGINNNNGVLKTVAKRYFTSTYIAQSFSFNNSNVITQSIYFKPSAIKDLNVDALKFGLIGKAGDQLKLNSSDSSFMSFSIKVSKDEKKWGLNCYNKINSVDSEIVDSTLTSFIPKSTSWYKLSITWVKNSSNSIEYSAVLDDYKDGGAFVIKEQILNLSGTLNNSSISNSDSIFAAIEANREAGIDAVDNFFIYNQSETLVGIGNKLSQVSIPQQFELSQNYPNPFNPSTTIEYSISNTGNENFSSVQIRVYDILGRVVTTLVNKNQKPGHYKVQWNAKDLSSGIYFYKITAGNFVTVKKMMYLK